jgi:hypothetical protein
MAKVQGIDSRATAPEVCAFERHYTAIKSSPNCGLRSYRRWLKIQENKI